MNPNQPPHYPGNQPGYPGGAPGGGAPGQPPNYPAGFPFPIYQAGMPHPYMPPTTPQYPQPGGGQQGIPANFMNVQTSPVKPEPAWSQDSRYGMPGPSGAAGPSYGGYPHMGMQAMDMDARNADAPVLYPAQSTQSLLAQHLSSAPLPSQPAAAASQQPASQQQQQSHLTQLLTQTYPGMPQMAPATGEMSRLKELEAVMAQRNREVLQAQELYVAQQKLRQQHEEQAQTRAAQLQAEQAAAAAAYAATSSTSLIPPQAQGFPASTSSTHSLYGQSRGQMPDTVTLGNQIMPLLLARDSPHQKDVDLTDFTTGELCQYGRELCNELNGKTSQLSSMLKKVMEKKVLAPGENPNELAANCQYNIQQMSEIRQIIETRRLLRWQRLTGDEYIEMMLDDSELEKPIDEKRQAMRIDLERRFPNIMSKTPPKEGDVLYQGRWISAALHKKYMKFEENKSQLMMLSSQLKQLAWKVEVTSPLHLKRVDQTKISKKKPDELNQ